jgi:hypothetical protein
MKLEATKLRWRDNTWAVRPEGQLGSCGFYPKPWTAVFVKANSAEDALRKAKQK